MKEVVFYKTSSGQSPIEDFLDTLSPKQAQKVAWVLKLVEDLDFVPAQYFKKIVNTDDLWEIRVAAGSSIFRFLGFFDGSNLIVLTHGFQKKTQKIPKHDIKIAQERKHHYLRRKKK
ncbi:MAG: type II toxin-antitoxin system RelE/ParE family toxin [Candidatus Thermoplasmatota archaeon]|nr:type II toxin-antitoxin system RelE/ParE family toxin [Candidatus Thermoplasmatota archaeon]